MPGCRLLPFVLLLGALLPASAHAAATVSHTQPYIEVTSTADEVNDLEIEVVNGRVVLRDHGSAGLVAGTKCVAESGGAVSCGAATAVLISFGPGNDRLRGSTGDLRRVANGGEGDDELTGGRAEDLLRGDEGDDVVDGGRNADHMEGGTHGIGGDTVRFQFDRDASEGIRADVSSEHVSGNQGAWTEHDALGAFENAVGSGGGDTLVGGPGTNRLEGGPGNDLLHGAGGPDELVGEEGNDTFTSDLGPDGHDVIYGGEQDAIDDDNAGDRVWYNRAGAQRLHVDGDGMTSNNGDVTTNEDDAFHGIESASGGSGPDQLVGDEGANHLNGNGGADDVEGRDGADRLEGGPGVDVLAAGPGDDLVSARDDTADATIDCGEGTDRSRIDLALEGTPRPAGCETLAPVFAGRPVLTGEVRAGKPLGFTGLTVAGDAATQTVEWWSCLTDEAYEDVLEEDGDAMQCVKRAQGVAYTPVAADVGRRLYASFEVLNAAGSDYNETDWSDPVAAAPVVEEEPKTGQQPGEQQPAPSPAPTPSPAPSPSPGPGPRVGPPAAEAPAVIAQRLLGGRPVAAGAVGVLRLYTAKRALALVCTGASACKARVTLTAGRKRLSRKTLTIAAGTGVVVRLPRKVRKAVVAVEVGGKTAKRTLKR